MLHDEITKGVRDASMSVRERRERNAGVSLWGNAFPDLCFLPPWKLLTICDNVVRMNVLL
jgi:hypothetical protein